MMVKANEAAEIPTEIFTLGSNVIAALTPGKGRPLPVSACNVMAAFRAASALCIGLKPSEAKLEKLFGKNSVPTEIESLLVSESLANQRVIQARSGLLAAVCLLGSHSGKVPDARCALGAMVPDPTVTRMSDGTVGVHSGSVRLTAPMSGSGNAALNPNMRFLAFSLSIDGAAPVSLAGILAEDCPVRQAILSGLDDAAAAVLTEVGEACAKRLLLGGGVPATVESGMPQVFFPVSGGEYVALSPLYPHGPGAELHARFQKRLWGESLPDRQFLETRIAHVGGTKPWNSGLMATYISGRFPRLVGKPPTEFSKDNRVVLKRFLESGLPLAGGAIGAELVDAYFGYEMAHQMRPNVNTRDAMLGAVGAMCDAALANVAVIAREEGISVALHGLSLVRPSAKLPVASTDIASVLGLGQFKSGDSDFDRLAEIVACSIHDKLHGRKPAFGRREPFVVDDAKHSLYAAVAVQKLREFA